MTDTILFNPQAFLERGEPSNRPYVFTEKHKGQLYVLKSYWNYSRDANDIDFNAFSLQDIRILIDEAEMLQSDDNRELTAESIRDNWNNIFYEYEFLWETSIGIVQNDKKEDPEDDFI